MPPVFPPRLIPASLLMLLCCVSPDTRADEEVKAFRVPYQLTDTRHVLVRAKVNGKGPFNFIVDTGAPALYLGTEAAKQLDLKPDDKGWGTFDRFEIEGGVILEKVKGRIEDPFQLTGMNKMNLAGQRYDGVLGYTVLAKFRITYDFSDSHMTWTPLKWEPPKPVGLGALSGKGTPAEVDAMAGIAKFASSLMGKRPATIFTHRGLLGVELEEKNGKPVIARILPNTPAANSGLQPGDLLKSIDGKEITTLADAQKHAQNLAAEAKVRIGVERAGEIHLFNVTTVKGL
jgi:hypothetical protein